jgi:predicted dehydrogenase
MNRKSFLTKIGAATTLAAGFPYINVHGNSSSRILEYSRENRVYGAGEQINIALIGAGWMGQVNGVAAMKQSGARMVAACDLYDSRLARCRELFDKDLFITKDYHEILERSDVDAVIISTTDHWHDVQAADALRAGKAVYLEKPMVQHVDQAYEVIRAEKETGNVLQIGSQLTSDILYLKARDLVRGGEIGDLVLVEGNFDRYSAEGAWQYSIPPGVTARDVAWETYLKDLPYREFDPKQFFRWRNYQDFGTGACGDLFVHLLSAVHLVTDSYGPSSIMTTGGLRYWHDGRDVPDVMLGMLDYDKTEQHPAFNLALRVNFIDGSGGGVSIRFVGTGGEIIVDWTKVTVRKAEMDNRPPVTIDNFSGKTQEEFMEYYRANYPEPPPRLINPSEFVYHTPEGYDSRDSHFSNFFASVREDMPVYQNGTTGLRAAAPALLSNISYHEKKIIQWDPVGMKVL